MKEFLRKFPKIELNLELAERIPDLSPEPLDIVIGISISATGDVIQKRIAKTRYIFAASPQYLKKMGTPKKLAHSARKIDENPYITVNDVEAMLELALEGLGIIKVHDYAIDDYLKTEKLIEVMKGPSDIPIYVAYPNRRYVPSKTRCFMDFFLEKIKNAAEGA